MVEVVTTRAHPARACAGCRAREKLRGVYNAADPAQARRAGARATSCVALAAGGGMAALACAVATRRPSRRASRPSSSSTRSPEGGGAQRGERDAGGLPRLRHLRRGAWCWRWWRSPSTRCCGASGPATEMLALPPQQRVLPPDLQTDLLNPRHGARHRRGLPDGPRRAGAPAAAGAGLVAVYFFLRGHNAPGGGFVAGLVTVDGAAAPVHRLRARSGWRST